MQQGSKLMTSRLRIGWERFFAFLSPDRDMPIDRTVRPSGLTSPEDS